MTELGRFSMTCRWRPRDPWHQRPHLYLDASIRCLPWRKMQDLRVGVRHDNCWLVIYTVHTYVNSSSFKKPTRVMHLCVWEWQYHATCLRGGDGWVRNAFYAWGWERTPSPHCICKRRHPTCEIETVIYKDMIIWVDIVLYWMYIHMHNYTHYRIM